MKNLLSTRSNITLQLGRIIQQLRHLSALPKASGKAPGTLHYACNICGRNNAVSLCTLPRDERTCLGCGSTLRQRSLISALSRKLFDGKSINLDAWTNIPTIRFKGISDADLISNALSQKLDYQNTFYHQAPFLDITAPGAADLSSCDVLICSDVLEHVSPPVQRAFDGMRKVIRPDGFLLLTVPCNASNRTTEHFPNLNDYRIHEHDGRRSLINRTKDGETEQFDNLIFHGGPGETLELRHFALHDLEQHLLEAGFSTIEVFAQPDFEHGVYWQNAYSVPIIAS